MNIQKLDLKHFNLEITKKCNQKCFYCFNDSGYSRSKDELSLEDWKRSLTDIFSLGFKSVHITGGEPFLHPHIKEILQHATGTGLDTTVLSNGFKIATLCNESPALLSKLTLAQISLDSMNPQIHNSRRGYKSAYGDAISAIKSLQGLDVPIEISTTVSEENLEEILEIGRYSKSIDASLVIRPLINEGRANNIEHNFIFRRKLQMIIKQMVDLYDVKVITDRFKYVANKTESDSIIFNDGILTVEATGKIRSNHFSEINLTKLLHQLIAA